METMTPLDFLDFRDLLRPASGFQSMQFKILEARLGPAHGEPFRQAVLHQPAAPRTQGTDRGPGRPTPTLRDLVNAWLERMPFLQPAYWPGEATFFGTLEKLYVDSLVKGEEGNADLWKEIFTQGADTRHFSPAAARSALFIMLYRDEPIFQQAFRFLDQLVILDSSMARWRARHIDMVHRMIGLRVGTGGSTGKNYLRGAMDHHYVFNEIADLGSFLFERRKLPALPDEVKKAVRFAG
jgi:tryptophan 2,3-dioxygenase